MNKPKNELWPFLIWPFLLMLLSGVAHCQDIVIKKDTTINNTWILLPTQIVRFETGGFIRGKGCLQGGIYQAAESQQIFDTSIVLKAFKSYNGIFSCAWYGAGKYQDSWWPIQKSINTCIENGLLNCYLPGGSYNISQSLKIFYKYKGLYSGVPTHFYGSSNMWLESSVINYLPSAGFCLGIQVGKGAEVDHLTLRGSFKAPITAGLEYYTTPIENFGPDGLFGLIIDYDGSLNSSGSTAVQVHDIKVTGFTILYSISPNGVTVNADILSFNNIQCGEGRIGFQTSQAQEKGNWVRNITSWGRLHTLISIGRAGKKQAGNYHFDGGNIAGGCIRLFDINQQGWYTSTISNLFAESLWTIGNMNTGDSKNMPPLPISSCIFQMAIIPGQQDRLLLSSNSAAVKFQQCTFRFYGAYDTTLNFAGPAMYDNCTFSGPVRILEQRVGF